MTMTRRANKVDRCGQITGLFSPFLESRRMQAVLRFIGEDPSILDVGCGSAAILGKLSNVKSYMGIDVVEGLIENNRRVYPQHKFACINIEKEVLRGKQFDNILLMAIVEHLQSPRDVLKNLEDVLSIGGRIIITTPAPIARNILRVGARLGLFSKEAESEHRTLMSDSKLLRIAGECELKVEYLGRFLFGMNQILVLRKRKKM